MKDWPHTPEDNQFGGKIGMHSKGWAKMCTMSRQCMVTFDVSDHTLSGHCTGSWPRLKWISRPSQDVGKVDTQQAISSRSVLPTVGCYLIQFVHTGGCKHLWPRQCSTEKWPLINRELLYLSLFCTKSCHYKHIACLKALNITPDGEIRLYGNFTAGQCLYIVLTYITLIHTITMCLCQDNEQKRSIGPTSLPRL